VIEPLYITDPFEGSIALSSQGQAVIAQGSPRPSSTISPATGEVASTTTS